MVFTYIDYRGYRGMLWQRPTGRWEMTIRWGMERVAYGQGYDGQKDALLRYARQLIDDDIARRGGSPPAGSAEAQGQW